MAMSKQQCEKRKREREAGDAAYLAECGRPTEAARVATDRANEAEADASDTHRLETYDEAWTRLGLPGRPSVPQIVARGVVRQLVPKG